MSSSEVHDFPSEGHSAEILSSINILRKRNLLCDAILCVEGRNFPVHRVILAACSDYFEAMFTSGMSESSSEQARIEIKGLSANTMEILLDFIYTETVKVSVENVQALLPAACLLQLNGAKRACSAFLESQLDPANCLGVKNFAETHHCESLRQAAEKFIHKHFVDLIKCEEFLQLECNDIKELIQNDNITIPSEEVVYEAVMMWIKHNTEDRKEYLPSLLENVRLPLLTPRYLTDVIDDEVLVHRSFACRDLVDEAKKYHLRPECRMEMQSERTRARLGTGQVLYVLGGFGELQTPVDVVERFDSRTNKSTLIQAMRKKRRYLCSVSLGSKLYAIGGYDGSGRLNSVECYDVTKQEWTPSASMVHRRGLAGAAVLNGKIYVAGGFDGSVRHTSVECYDPTIDRWTIVGETNTGREGAGLVNMDETLYCLGGYDGNAILNSVERFDPRTGDWSPVATMRTPRSGAGVAGLDSQLYAIGGYDGTQHLNSTECYSACANRWMTLKDMKYKRCYVGTAVFCSQLHAIGGYDGSSLLDTIEKYNSILGEWELVSKLQLSRCDMGVAVVMET
ncbi:kelch-like protein 12 [Dendronephthya gigantea]|uniref:kelch-like protein 12 n=1 Tax=Dendronephthya gigantea TaxID=151771 RepID=UPI00106B124E|nr:kelch-like protein 12 [Dendronephthya gigantea]